MRYITQGLSEHDAGRKDLLLDIATEELSHPEVIGSIVAMLNKGVKAQLSEGSMEKPSRTGVSVPAASLPRRALDRRLHRQPVRADRRSSLEH